MDCARRACGWWFGVALVTSAALGQTAQRGPREPSVGLLYYAKADFAAAENAAVIANPHICGALFQVVWSEVERENGRCDWSELDRWMAPWLEAGKKVAVRFLWSTSGNWPKPYYKKPTPQWVWGEGARFAFHAPSGTEMPLIWDPIYRRYADRFLAQFAARYDQNPNLLFVDVTPGAETNPYRFGTIRRTDPKFADQFETAAASDGRCYSEDLWLQTLQQWIDAADRTFRGTPPLVTLNVGGLRGADRSATIGDYCVRRGFYVGQNGLNGSSYQDRSGGRTAAFLRWSGQTRLFFEMATGTGGRPGSLMEIMQAAQRIGCSYLNVYPEDVLRGTRGNKSFDPSYEEALAYGARVVGKGATLRAAGSAQPASGSAPAARKPPALSRGTEVKDFRLEGERWTCVVDGQTLSGILRKPEGKGPFPAILISHGLGGSAESFGLVKAREFVGWGMVCIAPNYTHSVRAAGPRSGSQRAPGPKPVSAGAPSDYGASPENLRRAEACLEILRAQPEVDARRIVAYGHSMGGFVTIGLAAGDPQALLAAAITGSGVAPRGGFPAPAVDAADRIRTPLLMLHGADDRVVRPEQSAALQEVLQRNQVANKRYVFEGHEHPVDQSHREEVLRLIRQWFREHGVLKDD